MGYACARSDLTEMRMDDGLVILDKSNEKVHQLNGLVIRQLRSAVDDLHVAIDNS